MAGMIASKTGFYITYLFLFIMGVLLVANYTNVETKFDNNLNLVQDSVVANRFVSCISEDGKFGEIDEAKISEDYLNDCFGERYSFIINLERSDALNKQLTFGKDANSFTQFKRYVLVDGKSAVLEVRYYAA